VAVGDQDRCRKRGIGVDDAGMIGYTLSEIRRLLINLVHQARLSHYKRRGYPLT
jgi:hypothetical protein